MFGPEGIPTHPAISSSSPTFPAWRLWPWKYNPKWRRVTCTITGNIYKEMDIWCRLVLKLFVVKKQNVCSSHERGKRFIKRRVFNLGQKGWKAFKFESPRRVIIVPLHIAVAKILLKTLMAMCMIDVVLVKFVFLKNSISVLLSLLWLPWQQFELDV